MHKCFHLVAKLVERDVANKSWTILIIIGCVLAVVITVIIGKLIVGLCIAVYSDTYLF